MCEKNSCSQTFHNQSRNDILHMIAFECSKTIYVFCVCELAILRHVFLRVTGQYRWLRQLRKLVLFGNIDIEGEMHRSGFCICTQHQRHKQTHRRHKLKHQRHTLKHHKLNPKLNSAALNTWNNGTHNISKCCSSNILLFSSVDVCTQVAHFFYDQKC